MKEPLPQLYTESGTAKTHDLFCDIAYFLSQFTF